ncbi:hypothetical protein Leryth_019585 [Lithospermum erythrorhizon]|nr:hypothetical protein Leryth_019585 [Lithospermum erythrorhizon]
MSSVIKLGGATEADKSDEYLISSLQTDLHFLQTKLKIKVNHTCGIIDDEGVVEKTKRLQLANNKANRKKSKETTPDSGAMSNWQFPRRFVALKIMYFGKRFYGFASEAQMDPTVESEIFKALEKTRLVNGEKKDWQYSRCGRTDKGVSSVGQVIGLHLRSNHKERGMGHNDAEKSFPKESCGL